ncbi:MAG: DUF3352 domain-containing protein, partial [Phycisphaerae bacterium]|nr:DUF3352 domain-containing protein [Phycisphaerae bacterium]
SGHAMITGNFSDELAREVTEAINAAAEHARANPDAQPSRFQCRLVAQNGEPEPADEFPDPYDTTGQAPKLRVFKPVLLDESSVASAKVTARLGEALLSLNVVQREDIVMFVMGDQMLDDALGLLSGTGSKTALADDQRYRDAFALLPPPEDEMVFFDLQGMLKPIASLIESIAEIEARESADDIVLNSTQSGQAWNLCLQALAAYEKEDYAEGLALSEKAYEFAPDDSRVLYSLACFHALNDNHDKAIEFLERAVDGGFYCPRHISRDPDLRSLHGTERFDDALNRAQLMASKHSGSEALRWVGLARYILHQIMDAAGVIDYTAAVASTDGYRTLTESVAVLVPDAKERAIYSVIGQPDHLTDFAQYLPKETLSFTVSSGIDFAALYEYVLNIIRGAGPLGETMLEQWAGFQQEFGFDVQRDLISWFDGDSVSVTLEDGLGWAQFIKVRDEDIAREKIGALVELLAEQLVELSAGNPMLAMLAMTASPTDDERLPGFQSLSFMISPEPVVWGVIDNQLVIGSSADTVALCLATARGEHPNVRENARVMKEAIFPDGTFTMVSLVDQRKLGEEMSELMGALSMGVGMFAALVPEPEARPIVAKIGAICGKLTPILRKIDYFKSTASQTTFDGRTWHTRSVTNYFSPEERAKNHSK